MQTTQTTTQTQRPPSPIIRFLQYTYLGATWLYLICLIIQVYLASLSIFATASWIEVHSVVGWLLIQFSFFILPILAPVARMPRPITLLTLALIPLSFIQGSLVTFVYLFHMPALNALHPVNALALFLIAIILVHRSHRFLFQKPISKPSINH